jgi:hypothetical protein
MAQSWEKYGQFWETSSPKSPTSESLVLNVFSNSKKSSTYRVNKWLWWRLIIFFISRILFQDTITEVDQSPWKFLLLLLLLWLSFQ